MTIRIAMWSGPRNISTAMMRAWEARSDCAVMDEPFYGAYLAETGLEDAANNFVDINTWGTPQQILEKLEARGKFLGDFDLTVQIYAIHERSRQFITIP